MHCYGGPQQRVASCFFFVLFVAFVVKLFGCDYAAIGYPVLPLRGDFSKVSQGHRSWMWSSAFRSTLADAQPAGGAA